MRLLPRHAPAPPRPSPPAAGATAPRAVTTHHVSWTHVTGGPHTADCDTYQDADLIARALNALMKNANAVAWTGPVEVEASA